MGKLLAFLAIIRLARKNLFVTNDLAYFASSSIMMKKVFNIDIEWVGSWPSLQPCNN
jgi:hypothetical protein